MYSSFSLPAGFQVKNLLFPNTLFHPLTYSDRLSKLLSCECIQPDAWQKCISNFCVVLRSVIHLAGFQIGRYILSKLYPGKLCPQISEGRCWRRGGKPKLNKVSFQVFNSFYQWVALSLIGQALLFYCPRAVWLSLEGSLMKHLASSECRSKVVEDVEEKVDTLVDTFTVHLRNKYNRYFFAFLGCEILNLVMVVTQVIKI